MRASFMTGLIKGCISGLITGIFATVLIFLMDIEMYFWQIAILVGGIVSITGIVESAVDAFFGYRNLKKQKELGADNEGGKI